MVGSDAMGDALKEHRLPCPWRGHDQASLSLPDRRKKVHDPGGVILRIILHLEVDLLLGIKGSQVVEEDLIPSHLRVFIIDHLDF